MKADISSEQNSVKNQVKSEIKVKKKITKSVYKGAQDDNNKKSNALAQSVHWKSRAVVTRPGATS